MNHNKEEKGQTSPMVLLVLLLELTDAKLKLYFLSPMKLYKKLLSLIR